MRIGTEDDFLCIVRDSLGGGFACWRVSAAASFSGGRFEATHDRVMFETHDGIHQSLADFASCSAHRIDLRMSEGGFLTCQRDARGHLTVRYRLSSIRASASLEGELFVDGEHAGAFCRDLTTLITGGP